MKIKLKIGRNVFNIDDRDLVFDNGSCCSLATQTISYGAWGHRTCPTISKALIKELKKGGFIYTNHILSDRIKERYGDNNNYAYYKFNIDKMAENGYEIGVI